MHSVLLARWTYAVRMHSAYRAHVLKKKSTSAQRVAGALGEWPAHEARMARARPAHTARMQRALDAQPANGSGQMNVPIQSDGVSCFPSYRSREETRHTRDIQNANQERKCDVREYDKEDSCCCWRSRRKRSRRQRQKQRATHPGPRCCWRGCCRNTHTLSILIPSGLPYTLTLWVGRKSCRPNVGIAGIGRFQEKKIQACRWSPSWRQTKCYGTRWRPSTGDYISKTLPGRNRLTQWRRKSLTCRAVLRACESTSHAWTSCPSPGLGRGFSLRGSCGHAEDALPA